MVAGYRLGNNALTMKLMIDAEERSRVKEKCPKPNEGDIWLGFLGLKYGQDIAMARGGNEIQALHQIISRLRSRLQP